MKWKKSICALLAVKYTEASGHYLFIFVHNGIDIHFVIFPPFCHFFPLLLLFTLPLHSGAKSVRVRRPHSSAGRWQWVTGGHLHCRAWSSWSRGFLGDGAVRAIWEAESEWGKRHHHRTCALHVAATELRPGEDTHLCGETPSPADRVSYTLHAKCPV